ncbi:winged helix-turn-helix transcriptional regulator [Nonomuraea sp. SYSU D8015]|uniref:winged helix-turn-helix transcriptional regulator n=1 Tax=Nonomuraea sp. SYSU D8015 TaxID=2593644 RepID=UPI0016604A59|nr:winged helix-turn-helix transcriptional regulator [Nonomuraea sp. SYSU D8015]
MLALIGGKWSAQVLVELGDGPRGFTQLERATEDMASRWRRSRPGPAAPLITAAHRDYRRR